VISASRDANLRIWNIDAAVCKYTLEGHSDAIRSLDVGSNMIVSGGSDMSCRVWSTAGECLRTLSGHSGIIFAVAMNENGQIATGSLDHTARIWDAESGSCVAVLEGYSSPVTRIQFHGKTLISGSVDGHVRLWSLETMGLLHSLTAHQGSITSLHAVGDRLLTGGSDGATKLWDLQTGQLIRQLGEPGEAVWKVAFGAGGRIITTVAREGVMLEIYES
jgi:F-box and WD-40 domain protein CDC4